MIPRLHIVTDDGIIARADFVASAIRLSGTFHQAIALHIRARSLPVAKLFDITAAVCAAEALVVVNDRADIALAARAAGIQVGKHGVPVADLRRVAPPPMLIGYSAHEPGEAQSARAAGADFVLLGTIFRSATHPAARPAGVDLIRNAAAVCDAPIIAIGGITSEKVPALRTAGAYGVAVIRAVWDAPDPVQAAAELLKMLAS